MNIWTDDRIGPRVRYRENIAAILSEPYDFKKVKTCVESKVFGIGVESYTVGNSEFALTYAAVNRDKCIPLMDNGHCKPTDVVSDKIPALLTFFKEIAREIVRCGGLDGKVNIALDYFDASINRISTWTTGYRNFQKALPVVLLQPVDEFKKLQDEQKFSALRVAQEELKTLPFGEIWAEFCKCNDATLDGGRPGGESPTHLANHELKKKLKGGKRQTIPREGFIQLSKDFNIMNTDLLD